MHIHSGIVAAITTLVISLPAYGATSPVGEGTIDRPLGVLWLPATAPTIPQVTTPEAAPPLSESIQAQPTPVAPATIGERPLGTLWNPATDTLYQQGGGLLPSMTPTTNVSPSEPTAIPIEGGSQQRPLGTLWNPGSYSPPAGVSSSPAAAQPLTVTQPISPAQRIQPPSTATSDRPLGVLWGSAPQSPTVAPQSPANITTQQQPSSLASDEKQISDKDAVGLQADEMIYDREQSLVTASGNVEITYGLRKLIADSITYYQETDIVTANGNVMLIEPTQETVFGDSMQISGDLKDAVVENIGIIMADKSRIAGAGAKRTHGVTTQLDNAVYTPCKACEEDPEAPPFWQLKAVKIIHDKTSKIIEYEDVWLEMFGFPVAYTPYFRHPDPTVKRKSGLLYPSFGTSSDLGTLIRAPYFWNIAPDQDATLTPIYTSKEGPSLAVEYRREFEQGSLRARGSVADNDDDPSFSTSEGTGDIRGHILSEGRFDINDTWRWGFDLNRTSDDTYMRRYNYGSYASLNSQLFTEGFRGRNYFSASAHAYQTNRADVSQDSIPIVLPSVDFNHLGAPDALGGRTSLDANFLTLTRAEGANVRRISLRPSWNRPFGGYFGDLYNVRFALKGDLYHADDLSQPNGEGDFNGFSGRLIPEMALNWQMPFVKTSDSVRQVVEPMASFIASPYGGNSRKLPNEDSDEFEFDDANLFSFNRFPGIDRVEGGPRINYGIKWAVFGNRSTGSSSAFLGQTYRIKADGTFAEGSGLEDNLSDIVGRVRISPGEHFDLVYKTRFSKDELSPNRNEVAMRAGIPAFNINTNYVFIDRQSDSEFPGREEMNLSVNSEINRFWRAGLTTVRDMAASEFRSVSLNGVFEDECVVFTTTLSRTFFEDRDLKPNDAITFHLVLKTLGEVSTGISSTN